MTKEIIAWLIIRIAFAWMFLYPLKSLLQDWDATVQLVKLIIPWYPQWFAVMMVVVMVVGALGILFGVYPSFAGFLLMVYSLIGVRVHYKLAQAIGDYPIPKATEGAKSQPAITTIKQMGQVGHVTSAQKNVVLAAMACFFMLMGSGPWSLL